MTVKKLGWVGMSLTGIEEVMYSGVFVPYESELPPSCIHFSRGAPSRSVILTQKPAHIPASTFASAIDAVSLGPRLPFRIENEHLASLCFMPMC
jgi:hypothetical protein